MLPGVIKSHDDLVGRQVPDEETTAAALARLLNQKAALEDMVGAQAARINELSQALDDARHRVASLQATVQAQEGLLRASRAERETLVGMMTIRLGGDI